MMRRNFLLTVLPVLAAAIHAEGDIGGGGAGRRRGGLGTPSHVESVSDTPLTFEHEPAYTDRHFLLAEAAAEEEDIGALVGGTAVHRRGGLGAPDHEESVSAVPLTFEYEPEYIDRDRLLVEEGAEEEGIEASFEGALPLEAGENAFEDADVVGEDYGDYGWDSPSVDAGYYGEDDEEDVDELFEDALPLEDGWEVFKDTGLLDEDADEGYYHEDVEEDVEALFEDALPLDDADAFADEDADWDSVDAEYYDDYGGFEDFDSSYTSEDHIDYFAGDVVEEAMAEGEGYEDVGTPKLAVEPIARRLRRVVPVKEAAWKETMDEMAALQADEERYLVEKFSWRDDSVPIFQPTQVDGEEFHRDLQSCGNGRTRIRVQVITDRSGWENNWVLKRADGSVVARGPAAGKNYASEKEYNKSLCLAQGSYRFVMNDKFKDGMCGSTTGKGLYRVYLNGVKKFSSPGNCSLNWGQRTHSFQVRGSSSSSNNNNNNNNNNGISGRGGCHNVRIQVKVDKYGKEQQVTLTGGGRVQLRSVNEIGAYQTKTLSKCVPPGTYTLKIVDRDGICCKNGNGFYKMYIGGKLAVSGSYFVGSKSHTVKIGSNWQAGMSARDREWLNAHNSRRRKYNGGRGYVALRWSKSLASSSKRYAEQIGCGQLVHAKNNPHGENLAKNMGSGSWGQRYSADKIMGRWVENELTWKYPKNAHYTQVVWRATHYVGCGESVRTVGKQTCRVQVCRYSRPGNCNVRNGNWRAEAWKDDTGCGSPCPPEGCFV